MALNKSSDNRTLIIVTKRNKLLLLRINITPSMNFRSNGNTCGIISIFQTLFSIVYTRRVEFIYSNYTHILYILAHIFYRLTSAWRISSVYSHANFTFD